MCNQCNIVRQEQSSNIAALSWSAIRFQAGIRITQLFIFDKKEARIVDVNGVTELRFIGENEFHYLTEEQETCKTATNLRKSQKKYWSSMES